MFWCNSLTLRTFYLFLHWFVFSNGSSTINVMQMNKRRRQCFHKYKVMNLCFHTETVVRQTLAYLVNFHVMSPPASHQPPHMVEESWRSTPSSKTQKDKNDRLNNGSCNPQHTAEEIEQAPKVALVFNEEMVKDSVSVNPGYKYRRKMRTQRSQPLVFAWKKHQNSSIELLFIIKTPKFRLFNCQPIICFYHWTI